MSCYYGDLLWYNAFVISEYVLLLLVNKIANLAYSKQDRARQERQARNTEN